MRITSNPKPEHLTQIFTWLHREYLQDLNGFYGNYDVVKEAFESKNLICVIEKKDAIGYLVYKEFEKTAHISIANIKYEHKKKGIGRQLLTYFEDKIIKKGIKVIDLKCSPSSSKKVWKKFGFKEFKEIENHRFLNNSDSPYLYKTITEIEKPSKVKSTNKSYIELYCKDPIKKDANPDYIWKINSKTIKFKPIIYPVDGDWNIKFYKDNKPISECRVKRFERGKYNQQNFLIIDEFI